MMEKIQINSFYSNFKDYNNKDVDIALNKLSDSEIAFLIRLFNYDLNSIFQIDNKEEFERYKRIVFKIEKLLTIVNDKNNEDLNKSKKTLSRGKIKTVMKMFEDYSKDDIKRVFNLLSISEQEILVKAFGGGLDTFAFYDEMSKEERIKLSQIKQKMKRLLSSSNNRAMEKKLKNKEGNNTLLTNSSVYDMLNRINYKPLSRNEEINFVKKAKLSYYYVVSQEDKILYLGYYMEVFPEFKKRYEMSSFDDREKLLKSAIGDSLIWRNKFLENNQRLVVSIAKSYAYKYSFEDLVIEGNFGLIKALEKFDLTLGNKFSTYATQWVKQAITRFIANYARTIRIPVHFGEKLSLLKKKRNDFELENHRFPNVKELSEITNLDLETINYLIGYENQLECLISLSTTVNDDSPTELENFVIVQDDSYNEVDDKMYYSELVNILNNSNLDMRTIEILKMRYGLDNETPKTLEMIGNYFGITRERVRQIESKGLNRLRENAELLKFYNDDKDNNESKKSNDEFRQVQKLKKLRKIISDMNLSTEEVKIIDMFYIDNLSLKEISNLLGISISDVNEAKEKVFNLFYN